jgi:hypothetical protein
MRVASLESGEISPNGDDPDINMIFADALRGIDGISVFTFNNSLEALN